MSMEHNMKLSPDMDQQLATFRDRWIRARALDAAVAFHAYRFVSDIDSEMRIAIMQTADVFTAYIRDGKRENA